MNHDDDPFSIPGDTRPMCGVCFTRLSGGAHYATVRTSNIGTQIICAECIVQFAENRVAELGAEVERLRGLLRPIAEVFAVRDRFEQNEGGWGAAEDDLPYECMGRSAPPNNCGDITYGHMRECCAALGIEVPK